MTEKFEHNLILRFKSNFLTDIDHTKINEQSGFGTETHAYILGNQGASISGVQILVSKTAGVSEKIVMAPLSSSFQSSNPHTYYRDILSSGNIASLELYVDGHKRDCSHLSAAKEMIINYLNESERAYNEESSNKLLPKANSSAELTA